LSGNGQRGEVIASRKFGVPEDKRGAQSKGNQQNQDNRCQALIGNHLSLSGGIGPIGTVTASVQKSVFECPVLGEVHPTVVLIFPTAVTQLTNHTSRENSCR
jgi:hypothetical protein